jgi:hypothetical protein
MRFIVDGAEIPADVQLDDTLDEIKTKLGVGPVYLYAQKKVNVTSRELFSEPMLRVHAAAILANLNVGRPLKGSYDFEDFKELGLDGVHEAWIPLGQDQPAGFAVRPGSSETWGTAENRPLVDYLPLVRDVVYGTTETPPAYIRRFQTTPRPNVLRDVPFVSGSEITSLWVKVRRLSNEPTRLAKVFQSLHACPDVPSIRFDSMRRSIPADFFDLNSAAHELALCFSDMGVLFEADGSYEVHGKALQVENLADRINPWIDKINALGGDYKPFEFDQVILSFSLHFPFQLVAGPIPEPLQAIFTEPLAFRRNAFVIEVKEAGFSVSGIDHLDHLPLLEGYLRMLAAAWRGAPLELDSDDEIEIPAKTIPERRENLENDLAERYFKAVCALFRKSLQPKDREDIRGILVEGPRKVGRVLEVVTRVLGPKIEVVDMPASFGFRTKRARMLVPKTHFTTGKPTHFLDRMADDLVHDADLRAFLLGRCVVVRGLEHEVDDGEVLEQEFRVSVVRF